MPQLIILEEELPVTLSMVVLIKLELLPTQDQAKNPQEAAIQEALAQEANVEVEEETTTPEVQLAAVEEAAEAKTPAQLMKTTLSF